MKYIGLDVHSTHINYAIINDSGRILKQNSFKTSLENIISLKDLVKPPIKIVLEEGELANWIYQETYSFFDQVIICDPMENKQIYKSDKKSDKIDALKLAQLFRGGFIKSVFHTKDKNRSNFKQLVYTYHDMSRQTTRVKNKIKAFFRKQGIIIKTSSVYHPEKRNEFIQDSMTPEIILDYYEQLDHFNQLKEKYRQNIIQAKSHYPIINKLMALPGVGIVTASTFFTIIDTPERFHHVQQVWAYTHLGKAIHESAQSSINKKSKRGNRMLKGAIMKSVANAFLSKSNYFQQVFTFMTEIQHKDPRMARRIVARKMVSTMWSMWLKNTDYIPKNFIEERKAHGLMV